MSEHQDNNSSTVAVPSAPVAAPVSAPAMQEQSSTQLSPTQQTSTASPSASVTATAAAATAAAAAASTMNSNTNGTSRPGDELACMWQGCSEKCPSPEALYEHICERHVGRKSTNNLNLTCQWGSCRTTTVKRDHITSHIRVHVPLKPHKCDFCGKAFKRPQDLKKHVKTHADDSVLARSPEPAARHPDMLYGGGAKGYPPATHYFEPALNPIPSQGYPGAPQYYQSHPAQPANPSYGNVYYALGTDTGSASYESKKRGYDALNEFFGDLKRRQFDLNSYAAVGQRLLGLQSLQLPMANGPVPEYQPMPAAVSVGGGGYSPGGPAPAYHLPPMSNVRTKSDLINIDQFLEQMQNTIYESDDHVAASGVAQPGAHYVQGSASYRTTNSPPTQLPPSHAIANPGAPVLPKASSAHSPASSATPALTPPSSAQSYTSGRSPPTSLQTGHRLSPQHDSSSGMYPRLPSTTVSESMPSGYPAVSSAATPSTLSGVYDHDERRRYTGGTLQRARPDTRRPLEHEMDISEDGKGAGERTPPAKPRSEDSGSPVHFSTSLIDPALHSSTSPDPEVTQRTAQAAAEVADRADVQWVEKVRLIEYLRNYIGSRLERGEFEDDNEGHKEASASGFGHDEHMEEVESGHIFHSKHVEEPVKSVASLYPVLRVDEDGDSKVEDAA
ncbi:hypothetical protein MPDQ_007411 [Monascus purpureus]|uniref:pH-response transcription factor pacC/RIM101 n=2 Tax=Monascus TaxID=5097 RepID=A0A507QW11_MONPU|nr:pH-response transcription factor PacC [Monascus ruber]TQB71635.1 hypothetical protein MPDQ_007411 [Monascus purpureus]BDD57067.1 hypothetical protein MAP00_002466 [Monascus purpureus]